MAQTQDLTIARAMFVSALLRSEKGVAEISRDDATLFARTVLRTCNACTTSNVKLCTTFTTRAIAPSPTRTAALFKYLTTLAKSLQPRTATDLDTAKPSDENEGLGQTINGKVQQPPEPAWKRLHLLFIVHDILAHVAGHGLGRMRPGLLEQVRPDAASLAELAACGDSSASSKAGRTAGAVLELLAFWRKAAIFDAAWLNELRARVEAAAELGWEAGLQRLAAAEQNRAREEQRAREAETKWVLPERHGAVGDASAPWHELPAANGLYLKRTRGYPLRAHALPGGGFALRDGGCEAAEGLKAEVSALHAALLQPFARFTEAEAVLDVDALGHVVWRDPERVTRNYWGFDLEGVERRREVARSFEGRERGYADLEMEMERQGGVAVGGLAPQAWGGGRGRGRGRGGWRGAPRGRAW